MGKLVKDICIFLLFVSGKLMNTQGTIVVKKHNDFDPKKLRVKELENYNVVNPHCILPLFSLVRILVILVGRRNARIELTDIPHTCRPQPVKFLDLPSQLARLLVFGAKQFLCHILILLQTKLDENRLVFLDHSLLTLVVLLVFFDG
jgi:hypothetical protein